jgi:hypothetical protein
MKLDILFCGYSLVKGPKKVRAVFETKSAAITYLTGYIPMMRLSRRLEWNKCKREGWRIKKVLVAIN